MISNLPKIIPRIPATFNIAGEFILTTPKDKPILDTKETASKRAFKGDV